MKFVVAIRPLSLFALLAIGTLCTSCMPSSQSSLTSMLSPATTKKASANVQPGDLQEADQNQSGEEGEKMEPGSTKLVQNPVKPLSRSDWSYSGSYLDPSGNHVANTGFNFPKMSMVGSNLLVRTTAYCHKEADSLEYGRLNAAGGTLQYGEIVRSAAADWSRFPLGTRFKIKGEPHEYVIDDYGSALVGTNTIDIYKPTIAKMNEWGVRNVPIQILEWGCFRKSQEILGGRVHIEDADHVRQMFKDIEKRKGKPFNSVQTTNGFLRSIDEDA